MVIELTSKSTADEDLGPKRELYERLGIKEYYLFDPLGEYLDRPLLGFLNGPEGYELLPASPDGGLNSNQLGLRFVPDGLDLRMLELRTGQWVLSGRDYPERLAQTQAEVQETARQRDLERKQKKEAERQRDLERQHKDEERRRVQELEQEIARLRAAQPGASSPSSREGPPPGPASG